MALVMMQPNPLSPLRTTVLHVNCDPIEFDGDASFSKESQFQDKAKSLQLLVETKDTTPWYSSLSSSPSSRRRKRADADNSSSSSSSQNDEQQRAGEDPATLKVSFATGKDLVSSTNYTLNLEEFTELELLEYWYSAEQFQHMRKERKRLVRAFEKKKGVDVVVSEDDFRGLECKTKAGMAKRQFNIMDAMNAVLDEQERQDGLGCGSRHKDMPDPAEEIASLYRRYSFSCQLAAEQLGKEDAEWVKQNVESM